MGRGTGKQNEAKPPIHSNLQRVPGTSLTGLVASRAETGDRIHRGKYNCLMCMREHLVGLDAAVSIGNHKVYM